MVVRNTSSLKKKLGDILVEVGIINQDQLNQAIEVQRTKGGKLGDILRDLKFCSEDVLLAFLGRQCGVSYVSLAEYGDIPQEIISLVPESVVRHQTLIPIAREGNTLTIAMSDPLNVFATDDLKLMTGCDIKVVIASEQEIKQAIENHYLLNANTVTQISQEEKDGEFNSAAPSSMDEIIVQSAGSSADQPSEISSSAAEVYNIGAEEEAPVIKMVNVMLFNAVKANASDIHLEPYENTFRVRFRLDGVLHSQPSPPKKYQNAIISRIKVMAQLDVAERRLPQDGRINIKIGGKEVDVRVSIVPTPYGEKGVLRLLHSSGLKVNMEELGFDTAALNTYKKILLSTHGIILVTGPTGSGKTTTLYSSLVHLNTPEKNILTIEDPIEYKLEGINQVQARADIGLTFASGLRTFLRQDPDIIMVGEIRDTETAEIAINAALTGHLVLSTLHTNDAPSAATRINNMGIEPYLTTSTLLVVVAQRLMRVICEQCREPQPVSSEKLISIGLKPDHVSKLTSQKSFSLFRGKGCDQCANTGYKGRLAIYEVLPISDPVRELILAKASAHQIKQQARKEGMITLREAAVTKVLAGITSIEEALRVSQADDE